MIYDTIIVGGGPAGMTAAIYLLRAGKKVLMLERMMPGGQMGITPCIKNYPGFKNIDGIELSQKMFEQASELGLETIFADVLEYNLNGDIKSVKTFEGTFEGRSIILCLGASAKELQVDGEKKFVGRGISYCATCDGNFFKDKIVGIVGGGNTAFEDCLYLSNLAKKVYLIHRRDAFRGDNASLDRIREFEKEGKIELVLCSVVKGLIGGTKLESIEVENVANGEVKNIAVDGLFVAIGRKPDTELLKGKITLNESGYITTDEKMQTNVSGVFAAGDVREKTVRQIVTACSDGAISAYAINEYLHSKK